MQEKMVKVDDVFDLIEDEFCKPECFRRDSGRDECNVCEVSYLWLDIIDLANGIKRSERK